MKFQVFGCPGCKQPFQVAETQAGQVVQCPSCTQSVEIPANAFAGPQPQPSEQQVFDCPNCSGQFGVRSDMFGQQVGCPHCQTSILVRRTDSLADPNEQTKPVAASEIVIDPSANKKEMKGTRWKSPAKPKASKDMFAPGFEKPKPSPTPKANPPIQPVRRQVESKLATGELAAPQGPKPAKSNSPAANLRPPPKKPDARFKTKKKPGKTPPPTDVAPPESRDLKPPTIKTNSAVKPPTSSDKEVEAEVVNSEVVRSEIVNSEIVSSEILSSEVVDAQAVEVGSGSESSSEADQSDAVNQPDPIGHLLPPRFDVLDPERMRFNSGKDQFKVFLPDGKGGTQQVDQRVMRVEHGGEQVSLVAMSEKEKQQRRLIQNTIAIVIGIVILWIAFLLLR